MQPVDEIILHQDTITPIPVNDITVNQNCATFTRGYVVQTTIYFHLGVTPATLASQYAPEVCGTRVYTGTVTKLTIIITLNSQPA